MSFVLIIFFTFLTAPVFKATSKILIRSNPQQQLILFQDLATPSREAAQVNPASNLVQILTSQEMAQEVVQKFELDERLRKRVEEPEHLRDVIKQFLLNSIKYPITLAKDLGILEGKPTNYFADAVEEFIEDAEDIELEEDTYVINLSIWERQPKLSSDIANFMSNKLISKSNQLEQVNAQEAYEFTHKQLKDAENALYNSEEKLLRFKEENQIINLVEQINAKLGELHKVESEYIGVKTALAEARAKLDEMRAKIHVQKKHLMNSPSIVENSVIRELIQSQNMAEIKLAGDMEKFSESSIEVKGLKAQASESREKIEKELESITQSESAILRSIHPNLPNEYVNIIANVAALEAKKRSIETELKNLEAEAYSLSLKQTSLERLNRHKHTNEKLYETLLDKYSQLEVQKAFQQSGYDLKIIDKAYIPDDAKPDRPKWILVLPLGLIGSLILSFAAVFFIDYWDESFKLPSEIEERVGLPVLCTVSDMR
jgi:uncharacterized protein involved in exopolysaccharide biosynthesis